MFSEVATWTMNTKGRQGQVTTAAGKKNPNISQVSILIRWKVSRIQYERPDSRMDFSEQENNSQREKMDSKKKQKHYSIKISMYIHFYLWLWDVFRSFTSGSSSRAYFIKYISRIKIFKVFWLKNNFPF